MTRVHPATAPRTRRAATAALPARIEPMLAVADLLPVDGQDWAFEYKWDGVRCMSWWDGRDLKLLSRNQIVITQRYPELAGLGAAIGKRGVILDGEIVALNASGRPSFARLQQRMHVDHPTPALIRQTPVWYMVFDILYVGGRPIMDQSYLDRRTQLQQVLEAGEKWQLSPYSLDDGPAMLESAKQNAMEGIIAKLLNSPYLPGRRSPMWRKIKVVFGQELVIGGWIPEAGERHDRVGALLLGYFDKSPGNSRMLGYAGRVGTGFSDATHAKLVAALKPLITDKNPFADPLPRGGVIFVKPALVAEVEYRRWPADGLIQQASFKGLRTDKPAREVFREDRGAL